MKFASKSKTISPAVLNQKNGGTHTHTHTHTIMDAVTLSTGVIPIPFWDGTVALASKGRMPTYNGDSWGR